MLPVHSPFRWRLLLLVLMVAIAGIGIPYVLVSVIHGCQDTTLLRAVSEGDIARIRQVADRNPSSVAGFRDTQGRTLLQIAAEKGDGKLVRMLAARVDANIEDREGHTALWAAMENDHRGIAETLLARGASYCDDDTAAYDGRWEGTTSQGQAVVIVIRERGSKLDIDTTCEMRRTGDQKLSRYRLRLTNLNSVVWKNTLMTRFNGRCLGTSDTPATAPEESESGCILDGQFFNRYSASGTLTSYHRGYQTIHLTWSASFSR